jgi:hypothetical protein
MAADMIEPQPLCGRLMFLDFLVHPNELLVVFRPPGFDIPDDSLPTFPDVDSFDANGLRAAAPEPTQRFY